LWVEGYWRGVLFMAGLTVVIFAAGGLYRGRRHMSFLDELPSLTGRLLVAAAAVAIIAAQRHESIAYVGGFMHAVAASAGLVLLGRATTTKILLSARRRKWFQRRAVIVGGGRVAAELAQIVRDHPRYGLRVVGYLDDRGNVAPAARVLPCLGRLHHIEEVMQRTKSDVILLADVDCSDERLIDLLRRPVCMASDLHVVPRLHHVHNHSGTADHIGAIPVMRIRRPTLSGPRWAVKRSFDVTLALFGLILLSPVLLVCAIAVRAEGGRGVFYRQRRVGRHGRTFNVIKFRSMKPADATESETMWSVANDARVGPVGRFLRRTSLDEMPQLFNILCGDMTLVGPRPERPHFVEKFSAEHPYYADRHRVPAGLTGLAQVSGLRGDTPISDRARYDNYYIENWSLWLDTKVLLRTLGEVFGARGR
jgi:exopolysaccharide biosynthesis polyprenyl glycosylphosphotransferase